MPLRVAQDELRTVLLVGYPYWKDVQLQCQTAKIETSKWLKRQVPAGNDVAAGRTQPDVGNEVLGWLMTIIPDYWLTFVTANSLVGKDFYIPRDADESGLGAELQILDEDQIHLESEVRYPGIGVAKDGFIPVGSCSERWEDPYFINIHDGAEGPLYRISHEWSQEYFLAVYESSR